MPKYKIPPQEAHETMELYYKLTGQRIIDQPNPEDKLIHVHKTLQEYIKRKIN